MVESDDEWIACRDAIRHVAGKKEGDAKELLAERCRNGLLDSRAEIFSWQYKNVYGSEWDEDYERYFPCAVESATAHLHLISTTFWSHKFETAPKEIDTKSGGESADWDAGDFVHFQKHFDDPLERNYSDELERESWERQTAAGVAFNRRQLTNFLGPLEQAVNANRNTRPTTYDWEEAFADVAAAFYHDEAYEDINARGVQTKIIELLMASFEKRKKRVPARDSCKPKANKLLGALRSRNP